VPALDPLSGLEKATRSEQPRIMEAMAVAVAVRHGLA
jgi:hypothetical protein